MTAKNHRVSQVSHPEMEWERTGMYISESSEGYLIAAAKTKGVWCYVASGPKVKTETNGGVLSFQGVPYKAVYRQGEQVPPMYDYRSMTARQLLGMFRADKYGSNEAALAAAKLVCQRHLEQSRVLPNA